MKLGPAVCPYCGTSIDVPMVTGGARSVSGDRTRTTVSVFLDDVEWSLHLLTDHPDRPLVAPRWSK